MSRPAASAGPAGRAAAGPAGVRPWPALAVLCLANFLVLLDTTIVNTAAPTIMTTLDAGIGTFLWVLNGYLLPFASLLIIAGRLGDVLGPRPLFVAGLGAFTAASALCGLAQDPGQLVAARVVQGCGAAALLPQALVLIAAIFPAERRGAAFGIFTAVAGVASVSGPTLGGLLVTEFGWQSIFFLNVPVGVAGAVLALRLVPDLRPGLAHRFDVPGVVLATAGLFGVVYGLIEGERHDWATVAGPVTIPRVFLAASAMLLLFVLWERRQPEPLLPLALFGGRNFTVATLVSLITSFALYGLLLVLVIELQAVLGMSPLMSGVAALPLTLTLSAVAPVAGRVADRLGGRALLAAGLAVFALGVVGVAAVPDTESSAATFAVPLAAVGVGIGLTIAPATTEAMRGVAPRLAGAASGVLNTARQVGGALGAAVVGAVLQNGLASSLHEQARRRVADVPAVARDEYLAGFDRAASRGVGVGIGHGGGFSAPADLPPDTARQVTEVARDTFGAAFVSAARPALGVVAAALVLGVVLAAFMARHRPPRPPSGTTAAPRR